MRAGLDRTPSSDHVKVEERGECSEESASRLQGFDPSVESEHEQEDRDGFVVVGSSDGTRDVSRDDADKGGGQQACALILHLFCEPVLVSSHRLTGNHANENAHVSSPGGQSAKSWGKEYADVSNVHG